MLTGPGRVRTRSSTYSVPMRSNFTELAGIERSFPGVAGAGVAEKINAARARAAPAHSPCRQSLQDSSADECPRRIEMVPQDQELNSAEAEVASTPRESVC